MTKTPEPTTPEKLDLRSLDIAAEKRAELLRLFPECATEGGKIDFERLKAALGEQIDAGKERYGLSWPGKAECMRTIQRPSLATLRPKPEESVAFDTTQNLIIEGDNLEVLKLLQKSYLGKVKMIYIDPPYNTGNDFIYPDNYTESLETYLKYTGQIDDEGKKFSTNTEADGRFHSKWLNMMYPRLYLARNLLREDGVIFISIDDTELANLRAVANDVFGEVNLVANVVWQKKYARQNDATWFSTSHDHVLVYARNKLQWVPNRIQRTEKQLKGYSNPDSDPRGPWQSVVYTCNKTRAERPNLYYAIKHPADGRDVWPEESRVWGYEKATHERHVEEERLWWGPGLELEKPRLKSFLAQVGTGVVPDTLWLRTEVGDNQDAQRAFAACLPGVPFETPKPPSLVQHMLSIVTSSDEECVVVDFFGGSGTTAHAVLEQNKKDGGNRKFILVQLPEPTDRTDYPTIADITKERVRRVIKNLNDADRGMLRSADEPAPDRGFRVFQLATSNFKPWDGDAAKDGKQLQKQLGDYLEHVLPDRSEQDLLYEVLLKDGFELTVPVETLDVQGFRVFSIAGGQMLLCLQDKLTLDLIRALADQKPSRVVCLDRGFLGNDQLKANAVKIFASKGVEKFKTV